MAIATKEKNGLNFNAKAQRREDTEKIMKRFLYDWMEEGECPRRYHGHAFYDYATMRRCVVLVPFNFPVRWWMTLRFLYFRMIYKRGWIDRQHWKQPEVYQRWLWSMRSDAPIKRLPHSIDARDWAEEFVAMIRHDPDIATDKETMTTWFANSIMAGYDEAARRGPNADEPIAKHQS